uniref:hypothetical protein n=1 Tax=Prevotella sp. TaxID=59823 RepID=UPI00402662D8
MEEKQRVYIRGDKGHGSEVIDFLTRLGATATESICDDDDHIYFINHDNKITYALIGSEVALIVMDNYKEIELSWPQWKDGDVLVSNYFTDRYAVFKKLCGDRRFEAYLLFQQNAAQFNVTAFVGTFHLANEEEKRKISMECYSMLQNLIKVDEKLTK